MPKSLCYVVGYPGSGKTTAVAGAMPAGPRAAIAKPFAHIRYDRGVVQLGASRDIYSGTDALALNVQPQVVQWLNQTTDVPVVIGEGDRLGNAKFFAAAQTAGWDLTVVHVDVPELVSRHRAWQRGSRFDDRWFAGRVTKVNRLTRAFADHCVTLDGTQSRRDVTRKLREILAFERL